MGDREVGADKSWDDIDDVLSAHARAQVALRNLDWHGVHRRE
jgi:hypothetical protein